MNLLNARFNQLKDYTVWCDIKEVQITHPTQLIKTNNRSIKLKLKKEFYYFLKLKRAKNTNEKNVQQKQWNISKLTIRLKIYILPVKKYLKQVGNTI